MSRTSAKLARLQKRLADLDKVIVVLSYGPYADPDAPEWHRPSDEEGDRSASAWHLLAVISSSVEAEARAVAELRRTRPDVVIPDRLVLDRPRGQRGRR